jgi:hypothetical protein
MEICCASWSLAAQDNPAITLRGRFDQGFVVTAIVAYPPTEPEGEEFQ